MSAPVVAIGPRNPLFGSWNWLGLAFAHYLRDIFRVVVFDDQIPPCDAVLIIKFLPGHEALCRLSDRSAVLYFPVDVYESSYHIDMDAASLQLCSAVIVNCEQLVPYFSAYSRCLYLDHPLRFHVPLSDRPRSGPLLWIGNHANLPPVVAWCNSRRIRRELWVLTDQVTSATSPRDLGFTSPDVTRIGVWSSRDHVNWTSQCTGALDIKDYSFRSRNKPPAKANDFIASGVPFATLPDSSTACYWKRKGFDLAAPDDPRWFTQAYWKQTREAAHDLLACLSPPQIARQLGESILEALATR